MSRAPEQEPTPLQDGHTREHRPLPLQGGGPGRGWTCLLGLLPGLAAAALTVFLVAWAVPRYSMTWLLPHFLAVMLAAQALAAVQLGLGVFMALSARAPRWWTRSSHVLAAAVLATHAAGLVYLTQSALRVPLHTIARHVTWW